MIDRRILKVNHHCSLVTFQPVECLNLEDIKCCLRRKYENPEIALCDSIWDLEDARLGSLNYGAIEELSNFIVSLRQDEIKNSCRSAIVVSTDGDYGTIRMLQSSLSVKGCNTLSVFRDLEDALAWLYPD